MSNGGGELAARVAFFFIGCMLLFFSFLILPFVLYFHDRRQEKRRAEMQFQSRKLGLLFREAPNKALLAEHRFLMHIDTGSDRYVHNVMMGDFDGRPVKVFDFHYKTPGVWWWSPSWHRHCYYSFLILNVERMFPELIINAEKRGIFSRIAEAFGHGDIDFESREFSKRFDVRCENKKFAYDFCNAQMIDYLLNQPTIPIEVERNVIAIGFQSVIPVTQIETHLDHLLKIRTLMPNYLFDKKPKLQTS